MSAALSQSRYVHLATHGFFADPSVKNLFAFDLRQPLFQTQLASRRKRSTVAGRNPLLLSGVVFKLAQGIKDAGKTHTADTPEEPEEY